MPSTSVILSLHMDMTSSNVFTSPMRPLIYEDGDCVISTSSRKSKMADPDLGAVSSLLFLLLPVAS